MKRTRSGWCESGHCSRCPKILQVATGRRPEIHCDCDCHRREAIRRRVVADRRAQGLPDHVTDPVVLAKVAEIMAPRPGKEKGR